MKQTTKYLIIIASLMSVELTFTESKYETVTNHIRYDYIHMFLNVCGIEDRRSKVHCYCDSNKLNLATRADCWVFGGGITEEDPIWPNFSSQTELEYLTFTVRSDDALTFIPAKAIVRLDKLRHLTIQFGTIKRITAYAFTNSSTLRQIVLNSNKISSLDKHSFSQMMMLSNLSLEENQISELKRDVFFNLPNLHILRLSSNNLSLIHEGCFKHLINLIELLLDNNFISVVTREMFEGLENLSRLNLRNNKLTMVGNLAFTDLWELKELLLDDNLIEFVSERAFGGLAQLRRLTLSGNRITSFYEDGLEHITGLVDLDLRDNLLSTISFETIRPFLDNDKSSSVAVYLKGNPLECDCRLSWIYALRNETRDGNLRGALEEVSCVVDTVLEQRIHEPNDAHSEEAEENVLADDNYGYDYKEDYTELPKHTPSKAKMLKDIPIELLPCPKEIMDTIDESYGHPVQNEIKVKAFSRGTISIPSITLVILSLLF